MLRWVAPSLLLLLLIGLPARAADVRSEQAENVLIEVRNSWPTSLCQGYWPLVVTITNEAQKERRFDLVVQLDYGDGSEIRRSVQMPARAQVEIEIDVPVFVSDGGIAWIKLTEGGQQLVELGPIGPNCYDSGAAVVMVYGRTAPAGPTGAWADAFALAYGINTEDSRAGEQISQLPFNELPSSFSPYSSVDAVLLDAGDGLPDEAGLEALAAWVRLGGRLTIMAPEALRTASAHRLFEPWMEDRFRLQAEAATGSSSSFRMGRGVLDVLDDLVRPANLEGAHLPHLRGDLALVDRLEWRNEYGSPSVWPRIPGLKLIPVNQFSWLLVLVVVLLVPVNYLIVRLMGKPTFIMVTTPILAIGSMLLLVTAGLVRYGLDVKAASYSSVLLDQRVGRASVTEVRTLFAGTAPKGGLQPAGDTEVFPLEEKWDFRYSADLADGRSISGDLLPVRVSNRSLLVSDRATRLRLDFKNKGGELSLKNALDAGVEQLLYRDPQGTLWTTEGLLRSGEEAILIRVSEAAADLKMGAILQSKMEQKGAARPWPTRLVEIPPGVYTARLASALLRDDCGLRINEKLGEHRLVGIVAASKGALAAPGAEPLPGGGQ